MKLGVIAISALALAGCGGGSGTLSKSDLAALSVTSTMPTGSASYKGKLDSKSANGGATLTESADFALAANFDAKTVQGTATNYTGTQVQGANTIAVTATGALTGAGTISGSGFNIPKMSGTLTPTSITENGVAKTLTGPTVYTINSPIAGNFVGNGAPGIYGTGAISGGTYEVYGTKQ